MAGVNHYIYTEANWRTLATYGMVSMRVASSALSVVWGGSIDCTRNSIPWLPFSVTKCIRVNFVSGRQACLHDRNQMEAYYIDWIDDSYQKSSINLMPVVGWMLIEYEKPSNFLLQSKLQLLQGSNQFIVSGSGPFLKLATRKNETSWSIFSLQCGYRIHSCLLQLNASFRHLVSSL
jgi:hypothetical protein